MNMLLFRLNFLKIYALTKEAVTELRFFCLQYFKGFFKVSDTCTAPVMITEVHTKLVINKNARKLSGKNNSRFHVYIK